MVKKEDILALFGTYGTVVCHHFGDNNKFLILQFSSEEPVHKLLNEQVKYKGKTITIKRRVLRQKAQGKYCEY